MKETILLLKDSDSYFNVDILHEEYNIITNPTIFYNNNKVITNFDFVLCYDCCNDKFLNNNIITVIGTSRYKKIEQIVLLDYIGIPTPKSSGIITINNVSSGIVCWGQDMNNDSNMFNHDWTPQKYKGFYDNNFPKWYLKKTKDGFKVGNSDVYSSDLFPYLIYLDLTNRQDKAMKIEQEFREYDGFHKSRGLH